MLIAQGIILSRITSHEMLSPDGVGFGTKDLPGSHFYG